MKLCCISDTHGRHHDLDLSKYPADVLVFAGDWTRGRDLGLSETADFLQWLSEQPYKHKVFICGNHELQVEASTTQFDEMLLMYPGITYLQDSEVIIDDIKFYGSPYSNEFCNWAFMENDVELSKIWDAVPDDTQVLLTHGPAYNCNDLVKRSYGNDPHVGSKSLHYRKLALQDSLRVHISGHIHEAYNVDTSSRCINICPSVLNERYELVNEPILLEI